MIIIAFQIKYPGAVLTKSSIPLKNKHPNSLSVSLALSLSHAVFLPPSVFGFGSERRAVSWFFGGVVVGHTHTQQKTEGPAHLHTFLACG